MKRWLTRFMHGRYGYDSLGGFLIVCGILLLLVRVVLQVIGAIIGSDTFEFVGGLATAFPALIILCYAFYRIISKNILKRQKENAWYLGKSQGMRNFFARLATVFSQRKTHKFFKCPRCKTTLRVPKGKGKIRIKCTKCGNEFVKKT